MPWGVSRKIKVAVKLYYSTENARYARRYQLYGGYAASCGFLLFAFCLLILVKGAEYWQQHSASVVVDDGFCVLFIGFVRRIEVRYDTKSYRCL
jgi:hypothetical protein